MANDIITLGGGCFWCTEAVFEQVDGVQSVESGYSNGHTRHPSYQQVCGGDTGHNEVVRVEFDDRRLVEYAGVPSETWRRLSTAGSMWSFFRDNIEDEYAARRVK